MSVGDRIKKLRIENNISQTDLAKEIKVSKQTLYKYENNIITNIPSDKIELIANIFKIHPAYLMGWLDNLENFDDNSKKSDLVVEILSNKELLENIKKLNDLSAEHQHTIFDNIEFLSEREGH